MFEHLFYVVLLPPPCIDLFGLIKLFHCNVWVSDEKILIVINVSYGFKYLIINIYW